MADAEPIRMLIIGGVRYRPEVAKRLGLVDANGKPIPPEERAVTQSDGESVITTATATGGPDAHAADPAAAAKPRSADKPAAPRSRKPRSR